PMCAMIPHRGANSGARTVPSRNNLLNRNLNGSQTNERSDMTIAKLKASDRQLLLRKVVTILKKRYGGNVPKESRNVLETMIFACCLEDARYEDAEAAYQNLLASFHDLNEIRVSSISEVERSLERLDDAAWRAFRARDVLQYVFEEY